ncbi:hypothetical protein BV25DRAFT_207958 [Artomyces pyxidatus]|uniref:Uncharacterized protein n=1 Tax=Artomyces pyxidatus TaxID=48021 RepID=A0ACB8T835_9AGAM|nr:hypothetical protein BV25DRAFT_207958 [Artomyces pyxidatus]
MAVQTHHSPQILSRAMSLTGPRESAAYRIPVEIYREIFAYIPLEPHSHILESSTAVSQVCRHWRRLALEMKELWTYIVIGCPWRPGYYTQRVQLALKRSHPLPIILHIVKIVSDMDEYRRLVLHALGHISRAQELYLDGGSIYEYEDFLEEVTSVLETHPAPLLERFRASCFHDLPGDSLFRGEVPPKLRTVDMFACYPHPLLLRAQLTHLDLSEMIMDNIMDLLNELPSLEVLKLEVPAADEMDGFPPAPVVLPNLRSLELVDDSVRGITKFLSFLNIPYDADLELRVYGDKLVERRLSTAMQRLASVYTDQIADALDAGLIFRDLTIDPKPPYEDNCGLILHNPSSVGSTENGDDELPPKLPQKMTLYMSWSRDFGDERRIIPRILSFLPGIDSHHTLNVTGERLRFLQDWLDIATHGQHVFRVNANGKAALGLIMALNQTDVPVFPRLDTLRITDLTFEDLVDERPAGPDYYPYMRIRIHIGPHPEEPLLPAGSLPLIDLLLKALRSRVASGLPISRLAIQRCNVSVDMVLSLRAFLGEDAVEWDGEVDAGTRRWTCSCESCMSSSIDGEDSQVDAELP